MPVITNPTSPRSQADELLQNFRFRVLEQAPGLGYIDYAAGFSNVTTPELSVDEATYREGQRKWTMKFPGFPTVSNTTLQRGVAKTDRGFWDWLYKGVLGKGQYRTNLTINQYDQIATGEDETDAAARQLSMINAYPTRVKPTGDLDANSSDVSIHEIEVSLEELDIVVPA